MHWDPPPHPTKKKKVRDALWQLLDEIDRFNFSPTESYYTGPPKESTSIVINVKQIPV